MSENGSKQNIKRLYESLLFILHILIHPPHTELSNLQTHLIKSDWCIMDCRVNGTKPLFETKLNHCHLDHYEEISIGLSCEYKNFILLI